ncbi:HU family DNA-binding protein [Sangeribacter muris]|uniref:HU family DNA-binding protein n=1 Tax=Sangeribacter muris TaxID=2880703 RepID=UPI00244E4DF6|nr:HU family DNA-binding protein [Sangeribacter muris]
MNEKITLPTLVSLLADKTGKQKKQCEDFLREFFNTLVDAMEAGENVRIKSLGTFKVVAVEPRKSVNVNTGEQMEIPGHNKIVFVPAKELAEEVNAPFAMFESIEIPDNALEDPLLSSESVSAAQAEEDPLPSSAISDQTVSAAQAEEDPLPSSAISDQTVSAAQAAGYPEPDEDSDENEQEFEIENESGLDSFPIVSQLNEEHTETRRNYRFLLGFACGVACAAVICLCAYLFFFEKWVATVSEEKNTEVSVQAETSGQLTDADVRQVPKPDVLDSDKKDLIEASDADSKNEQMAKTEQTAEVPTRPSDEPVYDTITKTRYLTTMAKEHYGNYNLWPYIYEENKAILGHPDRIRPGTKVIVPPLSKYGVNPSDPDDIAKAKKKGVEIYAHYQ